MNKLLFLDVDGVLNCQSDWTGPHADNFATLDPAKCDRLAKIVRETGATVVLSSTWRLFPGPALEKLTAWLLERGVAIHSHTLDLTREFGHGMIRGHEIARWMASNAAKFPNPRFVILDDDSDMNKDQLPFFVQTNFKTGLTDELTNKAISILNKQ